MDLYLIFLLMIIIIVVLLVAEDRYRPLPVLNDEFAPYDYNNNNSINGRYYC